MAKKFLGDRDPLADKNSVLDEIAPKKKRRKRQKGVKRLTYGISLDCWRKLSNAFNSVESIMYVEDYSGPRLRKEVLVEVAIDLLCEQIEDGQLPQEIIDRVIEAQSDRDGWD